MRENRTCGSEGGEALRLPYPYEPQKQRAPSDSSRWRATTWGSVRCPDDGGSGGLEIARFPLPPKIGPARVESMAGR